MYRLKTIVRYHKQLLLDICLNGNETKEKYWLRHHNNYVCLVTCTEILSFESWRWNMTAINFQGEHRKAQSWQPTTWHQLAMITWECFSYYFMTGFCFVISFENIDSWKKAYLNERGGKKSLHTRKPSMATTAHWSLWERDIIFLIFIVTACGFKRFPGGHFGQNWILSNSITFSTQIGFSILFNRL